MTREEAIEFGKMWLELQEDCKNSNTYEFFKMAIEALQQEPTYTSEVAQKAYEDGKKDGYIQRKIETIADNLTSSKIKKAIENLPKVKPQEPCEDVISRAEVKKIVKEMYLEVASMELDAKTISDCISCTSSKCREVLERKLQALSSVTPQEPRWIPVTERLPEESDDYLITNIAGDVEMAYFAHPKDYAISKGEWREIWYEDDVIAWMPLPKSYKKSEE